MLTTPNLGLKKPEANDTVNIADLNYNADALDEQVAKRIVNAGNTPSIQAGTDASKPAPGTAGRLYVATDTQIIYRDTGSAWAKVGVVKWGDIDGKPATFPPSAHTHAGSDITSKVSSASAADTVPWTGVSGKPSSFPPSAHKSTHASGGSDPLTPGDIGAATKAEFSATLSASNWSGSAAPYTQSVAVSGITSSDNPIIDVVMSGTYSTDSARIEAWACIYRAVTGSGAITFYATDKPAVDLPVQIKVVR